MTSENMDFDVAIIGAGVVGCAIAREMRRRDLRVAVLERELDVGRGNSSRNSGVLHGGFTYKPGSLRARICIEGNHGFDAVAEELGVPFRRTGKVVVGFSEDDMRSLERFKAVGEANGARGLAIVDGARLRELDPSARGEFALHSPDSGILDPMAYTLALAKNAALNGAEFFFDREVFGAVRRGELWELFARTGAGARDAEIFRTRWVVNASGLGAAKISAMLGIPGYTIRGFKGEYFVLDKKAGAALRMPVYPAPDQKGGFATHATPTVDGNVLIGPDSYIVEDFSDFSTTSARMAGLVRDGLKMFDEVKPEHYIRNFAGIRAKRVDPATGEVLDFVCEAPEHAPGVINLVGIESPGLTGALPLARRACALLAGREDTRPNASFDPRLRGSDRIAGTRFAAADDAGRSAMIARDPDHGEIVCRCENVTKAEVLAAIRGPLGARTVDGVKTRTRATMGRCQGGYCQTRIADILARELGLEPSEVLLGKKGSNLFVGSVRP
ncbi:NAD(P)/FAD-dependent oxidoreductase [bacterium]|nr:NAD(P)/FAD-dependent oxidoreductase [bacterium]